MMFSSGDLYLSQAGIFGMLAMRPPVLPYLSMRMPRRSRRNQAIRPSVHVEVKTAVGVHVAPDQRRHRPRSRVEYADVCAQYLKFLEFCGCVKLLAELSAPLLSDGLRHVDEHF